jgi:hypothetical protein
MNGRMDDIGGALSVSMIARQLHALELAQADDNAVMEAIMVRLRFVQYLA